MTKKIRLAQKQLKEKEAQKLLSTNTVQTLQNEYLATLNSDPEFSLEPDPKGEYNMTDIQKNFIRHYIEFKTVATAAELTMIDMDTAKQLFIAYSTQQEIRRINRALYHRQFSSKLLTLDDIGGYLSSLLTGENVPLADQLRTTDKLRVVDLLIKLNEMKSASIVDPTEITKNDLAIQIKNLSVTTITQLLAQQSNVNDKNRVIDELDNDRTLTLEEKSYLQTLPLNDLLQLIEDTNKKKEIKNDTQQASFEASKCH